MFFSASSFATIIFEDFEGEVGTTFLNGGYNFSMSDALAIAGDGFGAGPSTSYMSTPFGGFTPGIAGSISIIDADTSFRLTEFDGWTSQTSGFFHSISNVSFIGTQYLTGTVFTANLEIAPTSDSGAGYDFNLNFNGTALDGIELIALKIDLTAFPANYIALDNLTMDVTNHSTPPPPQVPEPGTLSMLFSALLALCLKNRRGSKQGRTLSKLFSWKKIHFC